MATSPDRSTSSVILVVEDDRGVRESLGVVLTHEGYSVELAESGEAGLAVVDAVRPDVVVLDLNLGGISGLDVCRRLRDRDDTVPVLMLTARDDIADRVAGLDAGADDYLTKPFALDELLARVRAMLRRREVPPPAPGAVGRIGDLVVDPATRRVRRGDRELTLTKIEFDLLALLVANADVVLSRDLIYDRIWGYEEDLASNSLEVFISALRRKTEEADEPRLLHTVRGVGYVAREP
ncbi:MAG: response regulator transcription factor [Acidimicrobiales bacterium]